MRRLHRHEETLQRMVNAMHPGTYVTPHLHANKPESINILNGRIAVLHFSTIGTVENVHILDAAGPLWIVDIPAKTYHSMIPLRPSAIFEVTVGPYDPATHKEFADWAPQEGDPKAGDYLMYLTSIVDNW